jgi:hypothetical protein
MAQPFALLLIAIMVFGSQGVMGGLSSEEGAGEAFGCADANQSVHGNNVSLSECYCQNLVEAFQNLTLDLKLSDNLSSPDAFKTDEKFDANRYFSVLNHLHMETGYVLDYVYFSEFAGGEPVLYSRRSVDPPYGTFAEYNQTGHARDSESYLDHVEADGTPLGFFQYALLKIMGGQFYLSWHALYNDYTIACNSSEVDAVIKRYGEGRPLDAPENITKSINRASLMDFSPRVELDKGQARVSVVVFSKWEGFTRKNLTINREFPHKILREDDELLVPYDCGMSF